MTHTAVQRVIVRMLYDPQFAERVADDVDTALAGVDVSPSERAWLTASDPRAWRVDPMRRARTLRALLDEYPVSAALVLHRYAHGAALLDGFFSSVTFHHAIQRRASLPLTFGEWLPEAGVEAATATAALERAVAGSRRPPHAGPPAGHVALGPGVALTVAPVGTLALFTHCTARLQAADPADVVAGLLTGRVQLDPLPALDLAAQEPLLIEPSSGGPMVAPVSPELYGLLAAARAPAPVDDVLAAARAHGAGPGEDRELVESFVEEGLLAAG